MRIIVADDHVLVRDSLRLYLEQLAPEVDIAEASSLGGALGFADQGPPVDLIVLDLQMPGMKGPHSVADVRSVFPETPIVVVSGFCDPAVIRLAMDNGANGYIPKTARGKSLVSALQLVLAGERYLPPSLLDAPAPPLPEHAPADADPAARLARLTSREGDVLRLLIGGKSNKQIGLDLSLYEVTVKVHLRNVYRKLGAVNRTDAVRLALQQGWR